MYNGNGQIARKYGMISNDVSTTETVRNVFIIDDKGIVRTIFVYPLNVGRLLPGNYKDYSGFTNG